MKTANRYVRITLCFVAMLLSVAGYARNGVAAENKASLPLMTLSMQAFSPGSPFFRDTTSEEVYIVKFDCEYVRPTWESSPRYVTIKLDGVNAKDVETVGNQFIRVKGKLYDGFYPNFKKQGVEKTNNIGSPIDVVTFRSIDGENDYFQDKNSVYYYAHYPTSNACFSPNPGGRYRGPINFHNITLQSPEEIQLYHGQKNNIFVLRYGHASYTPYAKLNGSLYWRNADGQFTKILGADPENFRLLSETMSPSDLYTDGKYVFLHGNITEIDPTTFHEVKFTQNGSGDQLVSNFFRANSRIYYLTISYFSDLAMSTLVKTDADPTTFEVVDTNGSWSGRVYRDKDYVYSVKRRNAETETIERILR